ncbi:MAG: glycosyltransferase family protein [Candidatus Buchananbacteria bacterium]
MARIIYGVSGQGFGHSTRSKEIIDFLIDSGHEVLILTYGQALFFLEKDYKVLEVPGMVLSYKNNKLSYLRTGGRNVIQFIKRSAKWIPIQNKIKKFKPDLAITDFEATTCLLAVTQKIPLISIDNQHQLTRTKIACKGYRKELVGTKLIIKSMVWGAKKYFITTFYETPIRKRNTFLFPPIIRREVLNLESKRGDYILVYQNSSFNDNLEIFKKSKEKFVIFGLDKEGKEDNLEFKNYSSHEFLNYLAGCKAVIATAGLSLITESLHLKKPYLAMPVKKQVEQILNSQYLEKMGYGISTYDLTMEDLSEFLSNLKNFENNLENYPFKDNSAIFKKLEESINNWT